MWGVSSRPLCGLAQRPALGAALIQRKTLSEHDKNTAFWLTVGSGLLFTLIGVLGSGVIASIYGEPDARPRPNSYASSSGESRSRWVGDSLARDEDVARYDVAVKEAMAVVEFCQQVIGSEALRFGCGGCHGTLGC